MSATLHRKKVVNVRWEQWQGSTISKRYLSREARQAGYTVAWVLPACRDLFLDLVHLLATYGNFVHKHHTFTVETQEALARWYQATQALMAALGKEHNV